MARFPYHLDLMLGFGGGFTFYPDGGAATQPVSVDISCGAAGFSGDFNSSTGTVTYGQNDSASLGCSIIGYANDIFS